MWRHTRVSWLPRSYQPRTAEHSLAQPMNPQGDIPQPRRATVLSLRLDVFRLRQQLQQPLTPRLSGGFA